MSKKEKPSKNTNLERRDLIKGLATVPVAGVFLANLWRKMRRDAAKKANLLSNLVEEKSAPNIVKSLFNQHLIWALKLLSLWVVVICIEELVCLQKGWTRLLVITSEC